FLDNNDGKSGGVQARLQAGPLTVLIGYLLGPEQSPDPMDPGADARVRHLVDLVATLELDALTLSGNLDVVTEEQLGGAYDTLWGVMLAAQVRVIQELFLALRLEYIGDPDVDEAAGRDLYTGTFTIDVRPVAHLVIRLDNRLDAASDPRFPDPQGAPINVAFSSVLGVVVRSD
ncbi:MAG: outer membrane beta-barrel protein, partial [Sandaracinaceae bacterium]|nr:outer membrane beta-barrel protein [Sandaracinaceae bacterium]